MIHSLIYLGWLISFGFGFYIVELATEKWGFPGRIAAFAAWITAAMITGLGLPALLYVRMGQQAGIDTCFSIGMHIGIVLNAYLWAATCTLKRRTAGHSAGRTLSKPTSRIRWR